MELRAARIQSGKTQAQVAKEAKVGPGVRTAIRIARALGRTVEELFGAATPEHK